MLSGRERAQPVIPAISIEDPADPRIAPFCNIRERDLRRDDGLFIAEGEVVVRQLLASPYFDIHSLLLAPTHAAKFAALLEPHPAVPLYVAEREILSRIAGFPLHRGIIALGRRGKPRRLGDIAPSFGPGALVLAACGIANHDNIGGLFRNAAAFGADGVVIDEASCDPLYRKALRVSVGAVLRTPFAVQKAAEEIVADLRALDFDIVSLSPHAGRDLAEVPRKGRIALLVGAEGPGLPESVLASTSACRIAMQPGWDSLNVATAAAIALYEMRRRT